MEEVELYSVSVGNLPMFPTLRKRTREAIKIIKQQEGLVAIHPCYPKGTLLLFDTENNAKGARNMLRFHGIECGVNICKVYVDKRYLRDGKGD